MMYYLLFHLIDSLEIWLNFSHSALDFTANTRHIEAIRKLFEVFNKLLHEKALK